MEERNKGPLLADNGYGYFLTYAGDGRKSVRAKAVHALAELLSECPEKRQVGPDCHIAFPVSAIGESEINPHMKPVNRWQNQEHGRDLSRGYRKEAIRPGERFRYIWRPSLRE